MTALNPLYALAYTSTALPNLTDTDIARIEAIANRLNALDGVTGLLLFTGTHFAQVVEGAQNAIEDLLERLKRDERHRDICVHFAKPVGRRSFPSWDMKVVRLSPDRDAAFAGLAAIYPATAGPDTRADVGALVNTCYL